MHVQDHAYGCGVHVPSGVESQQSSLNRKSFCTKLHSSLKRGELSKKRNLRHHERSTGQETTHRTRDTHACISNHNVSQHQHRATPQQSMPHTQQGGRQEERKIHAHMHPYPHPYTQIQTPYIRTSYKHRQTTIHMDITSHKRTRPMY